VKCARVLALTGTPVLNRPAELWPLLHFIDPVKWASWWDFGHEYCGAHRDNFGWKFDGATNLDKLQTELRSGGYLIRRLKQHVLKELPPKRRQVIRVPVPMAARRIVSEEREAIEGLPAEIRIELLNLDGDPRMLDLAELARLRREIGLAKTTAVIEHVSDILEQTGEKIIVFAHHRDVVEALHAAFRDCSVMYHGGMTPEQKNVSEEMFRGLDSIRVFVGSIDAAGTGLNLQVASTVVFAEMSWVPGTMTQAEDRAHRIGQKKQVLVQHVVLDGSLDARVATTLINKQAVIDAALDRRTSRG
jgi:SWI/SNF-related matrix-associated actin-dependent regulator 1 of chromatin subfamily A